MTKPTAVLALGQWKPPLPSDLPPPQLGSSSSTKEKRCFLPQQAPLVDDLPLLGKPLGKQKGGKC